MVDYCVLSSNTHDKVTAGGSSPDIANGQLRFGNFRNGLWPVKHGSPTAHLTGLFGAAKTPEGTLAESEWFL